MSRFLFNVERYYLDSVSGFPILRPTKSNYMLRFWLFLGGGEDLDDEYANWNTTSYCNLINVLREEITRRIGLLEAQP